MAVNKDKVRPPIWISAFSVAMCGYLVTISMLGFWGRTADLPSAIRKEYSQINGSVIIIKSSKTEQTVSINDIEFNLSNNFFDKMIQNDEYTVYYLPHSKWVMEIIDENGISLKKRN